MNVTSIAAAKIMRLSIGLGTLFGMTWLAFLILLTSLQEKMSQGVFVLGYIFTIVYGLLFLICICLAAYADWHKKKTELVSR